MNTPKNWLITLVAIGFSSVAFAETAVSPKTDNAMPDAMSPSATQAAETQISDEDLQKFADVQDDIREIHVEYSDKLKKTESEDGKLELQKQANAEITQQIEDHGLDIDQYSTIALAVRSNPTLRDKVQSMMN